MGYESEPLPSYNELRNQSYSIMFKLKHIPRLLFRFMYHFLIPPSHNPARTWPLLLLGTELIYGAECHLCRDGRLPSPNVLLDGL